MNMHNLPINKPAAVDTEVSFRYSADSEIKGAMQMNVLYKSVRAAKRRGWEVDSSAYTANPEVGKIVFSGKAVDLDFTVFYNPKNNSFFGVLADGTVFSSEDKELYHGELWYRQIHRFFYRDIT